MKLFSSISSLLVTPNFGQAHCWEKDRGPRGCRQAVHCWSHVWPLKGVELCRTGPHQPPAWRGDMAALPFSLLPTTLLYRDRQSLKGLRVGPAPIQAIQQDRKPSAHLPAPHCRAGLQDYQHCAGDSRKRRPSLTRRLCPHRNPSCVDSGWGRLLGCRANAPICLLTGATSAVPRAALYLHSGWLGAPRAQRLPSRTVPSSHEVPACVHESFLGTMPRSAQKAGGRAGSRQVRTSSSP